MQQVNLYHPIFRQQRAVFSAATVAGALAVVVSSLLGIGLYGWSQVRQLESELAASTARVDADAARLQRTQPRMGALNAATVERRTNALLAEVERRRRAEERIRAGEAGSLQGFSPRLEALARVRADGLWLTRVVLAPESVELAGGALAPTAVPRFLESLQAQSALHGTRFEHVALERGKPDSPMPIAFELATALPSGGEDGPT